MSEAPPAPPAPGKGRRTRKTKIETEGNTQTSVVTEGSDGGKSETAAPKKRGPRKDYGYSPKSVITVRGKPTTNAETGEVTFDEPSYRGQRKEWYDSLKPFEGKTCEEWEATRQDITNAKGTKEAPRGWLRFFVQDGTVTLTRPAEEPTEEA